MAVILDHVNILYNKKTKYEEQKAFLIQLETNQNN